MLAISSRPVRRPFTDSTVAQLQARAQRRGRPRPQNDTWIAACCLVDDLPLATLNVKDFADFAEHERLTSLAVKSPDRYTGCPV